MDFAAKRHEKLTQIFIRQYSDNDDAKVFSPEYREILAKCMATKLVYGVTYDQDIEFILKRLNS